MAADGDYLDLGERPQRLAVGMLAGGYDRHVGEATQRLNAILAVGILCLVGLSLAWTLSIRNRELRGRLGAARVRAEHLAELGHAARGLAHETKNPLGLVRGLAQRIAGDDGRAAGRPRVGRRPSWSRPTPPPPAWASSWPTRARARPSAAGGPAGPGAAGVRPAGGRLRRGRRRLDCTGDDARVLADPEQVEQILVNLLLNSLQASPPAPP